jgi:hypothetical protein
MKKDLLHVPQSLVHNHMGDTGNHQNALGLFHVFLVGKQPEHLDSCYKISPLTGR